jgi:hypothetical protein
VETNQTVGYKERSGRRHGLKYLHDVCKKYKVTKCICMYSSDLTSGTLSHETNKVESNQITPRPSFAFEDDLRMLLHEH